MFEEEKNMRMMAYQIKNKFKRAKLQQKNKTEILELLHISNTIKYNI